MGSTDSLPKGTFWQEGPFQFIKPENYEAFGIDPAFVPLGTIASFRHPSQLRSRFGGNAYGLGLFEDYDRLSSKEIEKLNSISFEDPEDVKANYQSLNEIYRKIGLLIRFSRFGKPYYLIPIHLISDTLTHVKAKVIEITNIVRLHIKKNLKEHQYVGIFSSRDDLIVQELSLQFREHHFFVLDSPEKLKTVNAPLDLVILTSDLYEVVLMQQSGVLNQAALSKKRLDQHCIYILWKIYDALNADGEIFIIADHLSGNTKQKTELNFKTELEEKRFALFTHIFATKKKYRIKDHRVEVNISDLEKYLDGRYVIQDIVDQLLQGRALEEMSVEEIDRLPYFNSRFVEWPFNVDQKKTWGRLLSIFFDQTYLNPILPEPVRRDWEDRLSFTDYIPECMMVYLGCKKPLKATRTDVKQEVMESSLSGCPIELVAEYRNSFEFLIRTLRILEGLKKGTHRTLPQVFVDRLKQPLENRNRRFGAFNHVIKLISKIKRLERIRGYLNPEYIEGPTTSVIENLEALTFFGFDSDELREILLIVLGHTHFGRIISGKMTEKTLKPVSDMAQGYDPQEALNLLRYCRVMTLAETEAAGGAELSPEQLKELFDLYESTVRVIVNQELDWDQLLDEKITAMGGIHNKIIRKVLMMMGYFEFLYEWPELPRKGEMEKESLADYDEVKLTRIENVLRLIHTVEEFEKMYLKFDPLELPRFYRRFLETEFHGTGHLFQRMDSRNIFVLLWIAVSLGRGKIINFNPILTEVEPGNVEAHIEKVEGEARAININYLDLDILNRFRAQLEQSRSSFIVGTGFQISVSSREREVLEIDYKDMGENLDTLDLLLKELANRPVADIPLPDLKALNTLFGNLETFYQSHLALIQDAESPPALPAKQIAWFQKAEALRETLRDSLLRVIFRPEHLFTDLDLLFHHAPMVLDFLIPEFTALKDVNITGRLYLTLPVTDYIIAATRKFQALVTRNKQNFQDREFLHRRAQKEFGPMAVGIIGLSTSQLENLCQIVEGISHNVSLLDALAKSFIFQDVGRLPYLREKYADEINPAEVGSAGALFIEKENLAEKYHLDQKGKEYFIFLIRHHSLFHHNVRGEISYASIREIIRPQDKELLDAFFVFSFVMLSAIREDLILEDLAGRLFQIRSMCHKIIDGTTTLHAQLNEAFISRGSLYYALKKFQEEGLPEGVTAADYLASGEWGALDETKRLEAGKMIFAVERIFRLQGIQYVQYRDLVDIFLGIPLRFIHRKRNFINVGYATFEKEVYEAFRIYNTLQYLAETMRHFILEQLVGDRIRLAGYEKVSGYLSYENRIKLLLAALLGTQRMKGNAATPICLNFLHMSEVIEKRYEAVNHFLNTLSTEKLWEDRYALDQLFKAKTGILLKRDDAHYVLSIHFEERINIPRKISRMYFIDDLDQLKNYFHASLRSLRKHRFYTEDYELELEKAFEKRMHEIIDMVLNRIKKRMDQVTDFRKLYEMVADLSARSWDMGFTPDQRQRLNDLYELRKDNLKRERLREIDDILSSIHKVDKLQAYWDRVKWDLQENRWYLGKEFEILIAQKFDRVRERLVHTQ
ncbi:MAG: hypothetical protein ACQEQ7_02540 [Thermodesulfobacteriota bacterium]